MKSKKFKVLKVIAIERPHYKDLREFYVKVWFRLPEADEVYFGEFFEHEELTALYKSPEAYKAWASTVKMTDSKFIHDDKLWDQTFFKAWRQGRGSIKKWKRHFTWECWISKTSTTTAAIKEIQALQKGKGFTTLTENVKVFSDYLRFLDSMWS